MAFLCIIIDDANNSIDQLNALAINASANQFEGAVKLRNYLDSALAGVASASMQVTTRSTDPSVATAGSNSQQRTYDLK